MVNSKLRKKLSKISNQFDDLIKVFEKEIIDNGETKKSRELKVYLKNLGSEKRIIESLVWFRGPGRSSFSSCGWFRGRW